MHELWAIIGLIVGVLVVTGVADRVQLPAPILLLVIGFAVSFIPGVPSYAADPELVLAVLIPPLLYAAAIDSGVVALRRLIQPIMQLAFGLVLITAFAVALVLHAVLPNTIPFGAALALGAVVAPPDAVAAVAVCRRLGVPRSAMTILEGESLFNDATALVLLRVALATVGGASLRWGVAVGEFAWAVVGGVLAGVVIGLLISLIRRKVGMPLAVTALSLVTPYFAYLIGEAIKASGVLAVVVCGLVLGYRSPLDTPARVRLTENATWGSLRFVLEGVVFALIGLQLWDIVRDLGAGAGPVIIAVLVVLGTVLVIRPLGIFAGMPWLALRMWWHHRRDRPESGRDHATPTGPATPAGQTAPPDHATQATVAGHATPVGEEPAVGGTAIGRRAKVMALVSWSGMRGVISLAAAQTLPEDLAHRNVLLTCTVAVIVGTLVLQGLSLPMVIRRLRLPGDPAAELAAERAVARHEASTAITQRVDRMVAEARMPGRTAEMMHRWVALRNWQDWEPEVQSRIGARMRSMQSWQREVVGIEREVFVALRNEGRLSEEVLRELQRDLDLEEALLDSRSGGDQPPRSDASGTNDAGDPDGDGPGDDDAAIDDGTPGHLGHLDPLRRPGYPYRRPHRRHPAGGLPGWAGPGPARPEPPPGDARNEGRSP